MASVGKAPRVSHVYKARSTAQFRIAAVTAGMNLQKRLNIVRTKLGKLQQRLETYKLSMWGESSLRHRTLSLLSGLFVSDNWPPAPECSINFMVGELYYNKGINRRNDPIGRNDYNDKDMPTRSRCKVRWSRRPLQPNER
ncbi:hypothetical protein GT037_006459 [Alternaria burnsii]|uniref:Uncharacterized protein n=1 Tax=Alternaria burnsii TaxID=1187904 RepID=A0A8H7B3K9_9PLEO|nr:uncharacterized protein GT037_006459 [Alternaria burnsii]KAF7675740.1 hypothetical protein GT037_006459 [Alternaria burnsii]